MRGRIRSIKPELFKDEDLWDLAQETGLPILQGFEGLWCYADKEGRFEWRPRQLKTDILPYWDGDFARVLDALVTRGFVVRYAVAGREYGLVRTFKKHQVINNRESDSELPAPPPEHTAPLVVPDTSTRGARVEHASPTPLEQVKAEGKGTEGKGKEGSGIRAREPEELSALDSVERRAAAATSLFRVSFARRYEQARGLEWGQAGDPDVAELGGWLARNVPDLEAQLPGLLERFFSDPYVISRDFPVGLLRKQAPRYLSPPAPVRDVRKGFVEPAPASAFTNPTDLDKVFGPESAQPPAAGGMRR